ncbi:hypothetical protein PLICRDRAFT_43650 [Plicaturopsis crispa FD-325 SS-3]|nr:hypothetical protein PLICRDRAFT_43650 [Plicaturopsis crispa FD-325 SS-3]
MPSHHPQRIGNWLLIEKLGAGFSGAIFRAQNVFTHQIVALKIQDVNHECPTNRYERGFYPSLQGGVGMPTLWAAGVEGMWDYMAIDLLGLSLDNLFRKSGKDRMDLRSVCCIASQVIARLEFMHSRGILHRDIQLGNCVIGLPPNQQTLYMIDFGFSKRYIDPHTRRHIEDSNAKRDFIGNYWFSSVGVHCRGKVPSRRDDLEAVALMLIHLLTPGGLSWTRNGVPKDEVQHDRIKREKRHARAEHLCHGMPSEFEEFLRYCRRLKFAECPDYRRWIDEFKALMRDEGFGDSDAFVWPPPELPVSKRAPRSTGVARNTPGPGSVENILNDLANLKLDDRPILGDKKNVAGAAKPAKATKKSSGALSNDVVIITDDSTNNEPIRKVTPLLQTRMNKANQIMDLSRGLQAAADNATLADLVANFVEVLNSSRSKNLTKEGFFFLDTLYKQLADPSVFVVPLRTSRTRSSNSNKEQEEPEPRHAKLSALATLRREVGMAPGNKRLADMVADFGALTNKSTGRTVTKDGLAFLEGLATRLKELHS